MGHDGTLGGIPESYGKIVLRIEGLGGSSPVIQFKAGQVVNSLPACATTTIGSHAIDHISASGSWGHPDSAIPDFIRVSLYEGYREQYDYVSRIQVMFDLNTAELIDVSKFVRLTESEGDRMESLRFPANCNPLASRPN